MWTIDTFLDARSGYFFETNPSGLMADSIFGINGDNRQWDGIWDAPRPPQRDRLDDRNRDPVPHAELQSEQRHLGHQLSAHRAAQERREHLDGMGAQPGTAPHDERRARHRHHATSRRDTGSTSSRTGCTSPRPRQDAAADRMDGDAKAGSTSSTTRRRSCARTSRSTPTSRRPRSTSGRSTSRATRCSFRSGATSFSTVPRSSISAAPVRRGDLRVNPFFSRRIGLTPRGAPQKIDFGTKVTGQIGRAGRRAPARAHRRRRPVSAGEDFTVARVKRRLLRQSYVGAHLHAARPACDRRRATPHERRSTATFATSSFLGSQNLASTALVVCTRRAPVCSSGNSAFGGDRSNYPNDRWNGPVRCERGAGELRSGVGFVTRTRLPAVHPDRHLRAAARQSSAASGSSRSATVWTCRPISRTSCSRARSRPRCSRSISSRRTAFAVNAMPAVRAARRAVRHQPGHHAAARRRIQLHALPTCNGQTANRRVLAVNARFETGGFYSGTRHRDASSNLTVRAPPGLHRLH